MNFKLGGLVSFAIQRLFVLLVLGVTALNSMEAGAGTLTAMTTALPNNFTPGHMMLLPDGRVMVQYLGGNTWEYLSPDNQGHYSDGSWSTCAAMNYQRLYYSSDVLQNGQVFVAGGEYNNNGKFGSPTGGTAELFNPQANNGTGSWSLINPPAALLNPTLPNQFYGVSNGFFDSESVILPSGNVLVAPVGVQYSGETLIYNPYTNGWYAGGTVASTSQDEASWVKLPDDSILTIDPYGTDCQRYIPAQNIWIQDTAVPVNLYSTNSEIGAALLLTNATILYIGGTGASEIYTPSPQGGTNAGSWSTGPVLPAGLVMRDAPACILNNGKLLLTLVGPNGDNPLYIYEYNQDNNSFTKIFTDSAQISDKCSMLQLPDGNVLFNDTFTMYVYTPDGSPLPIGTPNIQNVTYNTDGTLTVSGTLFNGISQGSVYGDDAQEDSNYPLARFTTSSGNAYYGRTYNWSSTSVMTGSRAITTQVIIPTNIFYTPGSYSLQIVANGNPSGALQYFGPVWVNFNYTGSTQNGTYSAPYKTFAGGVGAVASGGTIAINGNTQPSVSAETLTVTKAMTVISVNGQSSIGN